MKHDDFSALLAKIQAEEIAVGNAGRTEYAHSDANVFANFDRISSALGISRERVLLVYALKHWDGIVAHINGHKSQREDVRGRIKDLRMYLAILWGMVETESAKIAESDQQCEPVSRSNENTIKDSFQIFPSKR